VLQRTDFIMEFKRLAIISDCIHMKNGNGNVVTENHIFCRQIEALAAYFEHTVICCPFVNPEPDSVTSAYTLDTIEFIQLPNVGGNSLKHKLKIIGAIPAWIKAFSRAHAKADIIYLRMPNNVSIPVSFIFIISVQKNLQLIPVIGTIISGSPSHFVFRNGCSKIFSGDLCGYTLIKIRIKIS
jgi:hypothetical protein